MQHPILQAELRTVLGKKVKQLRKQNLLPANVYGKSMESKALQVKVVDFQTVYKEAGETGVIDLKVAGQTYPVLVKNLQMNFRSQLPLHADFYQVNLREKIKTMVPIVLTGEAKAVADKLGMLMQLLSEVEIEALPDQIPDRLEVDVTGLSALGQNLTIGDLKLPQGVSVINEEAQPIAQIAELVVEEPKVQETPAAVSDVGENGEEKPEEKSGESKPQEK